jgi:hypothetical protein
MNSDEAFTRLPLEIIHTILQELDRNSYLTFGLVSKASSELTQDPKLRDAVGVFPYRASIPTVISISIEIDHDPVVGSIICIEKPNNGLYSLDIPVMVVYNKPDVSYIGVIIPKMTLESEIIQDGISVGSEILIRFGTCRVSDRTYLHREHFRLIRSSKQLIKTMRDEIVQKLGEKSKTEDSYYVSKISRRDVVSSNRKLDNMIESLRMGLTLSDSIGLNPSFRINEWVEQHYIAF